MIIKVALIRPQISRWKLYKWYSPFASNEAPLGLLSIASYLDKNGIEVRIFDGEQISTKAIIDRLSVYQPDFVGITSTTFSYFEAISLVSKIKTKLPEMKVYLGGSHVSALPDQTLRENPMIDGCIVGDGEEAFLMMANNRPINEIPNLLNQKQNDKCIKQPQFESDLDKYKFNWSLLSGFPDRYQPGIQDRKNGKVASLVASRGCDHSCTFCASHKLHGSSRRSYSPESVYDQMLFLSKQYGVNNIYFHDDNFTQDMEWLTEFCSLLSNSDLKINWSCATRIESLDIGTLQMMKRAGCYQLGIGLESCSSSILKWMNKQTTINELCNKIEMIHSLKLKTKIYFIIGTPIETLKDIIDTLKFVIKLNVNHIQITYYTPLPGAHDFKRYPIEKADWTKLNLLNPTKHAALSVLQLRLFEIFGYSLFYSSKLVRILIPKRNEIKEVTND